VGVKQWVSNNWWSRWIAAALLWTTLGLLFALPGLSSPNWNRPLLGSLSFWWAWGLVTPLIFWTDVRLPFNENQLGMRVLAHFLASIALTLLYSYVFAAMTALVGLSAWNSLEVNRFLANAFNEGILWRWLVYWAIFGACQTFRYYEHYLSSELRLEQMECSFSEARLNALRMQLDPHFLFNALNTISSQVERNPRLARTMIEHLGDSASLVARCAGQAGDSASGGTRFSRPLRRDPEDSFRGEFAHRNTSRPGSEVRAGTLPHRAAAG
jgi:two-component system LytT family sensor kinase